MSRRRAGAGARGRRRPHRQRAGGDRVRGEHDDAQLPARARGGADARAGGRDRGHRPRPRREHLALAARGRGPRPRGEGGADPAGDGTLDEDALEALLGERTRVVAFTLASNALGTITDAARIAAAADASVRSRGPTPCTSPRTGGCAAPSSGSTCCSARPTSSSARTWAWPRSSGGWPSAARGPRATGRGVAARAPVRDRHPVARGDRRHDRGDRVPALARRRGLDAAFERIREHEEALSRRFLEAGAGVAGLDLYGIADPGRVGERTPTFCFNLGDRPPARRPSWRRATSMCGTVTTTCSRRWVRSGCPSGARSAGFLHYTTEDEVDRLLRPSPGWSSAALGGRLG